MKIELNLKQYVTLLKIMELGKWPLGLTEMDQELLEESEDLEQYILSLASQFGLDEQVYYDHEDDYFYLGSTLKDRVEAIIDEYEEDVFWDQLAHKLATNELKKEIGLHETLEEKIQRLFQLKSEYIEYFSKNGLEKINLL